MNTEIKDLRKVFEKGDIKVVVEWHVDERGDISHYGEYSEEESDCVVDRRTGELLGEYLAEPHVEHYLPNKPSGEITDEEWDEAEEKTDEAYDEWAKAPCEVLAGGLSTMRDRHEYRYFLPERLRDFQGEWKDTTDEKVNQWWEKRKGQFGKYGINTGDKRLDLSVLYACLDYERVEGLSRGDWEYMGCVAKVLVEGVEVGCDSLWGIESDSGDGYPREVERGVVSMALSEASDTLEKLAMAAGQVEGLELEEVVEGLEN